MSENTLILTEENGILRLTMNAPSNNLMTADFFAQYEDIMAQVEKKAQSGDNIKGFIICGGGRHFSTGADVEALADRSAKEAYDETTGKTTIVYTHPATYTQTTYHEPNSSHPNGYYTIEGDATEHDIPSDRTFDDYFYKLFEKTSISTSTKIQEVSDEMNLKKAEAIYEADMNRINSKDARYDTELSQLETERNAIKQEMETLKNVAKENVDRTFKIFS